MPPAPQDPQGSSVGGGKKGHQKPVQIDSIDYDMKLFNWTSERNAVVSERNECIALLRYRSPFVSQALIYLPQSNLS